MGKHVLVVGGAGFLGLHVTADLLAAGHRVRVIDSLRSPAHGAAARALDLADDAEFVIGDVRDAHAMRRALQGIDAVVHVAADPDFDEGAPEGDDEADHPGTATLLAVLRARPVERVVVASSLAVYGEGQYRAAGGGGLTSVPERSRPEAGRWEPWTDPPAALVPWPTPESFVPQATARTLFHRAKEQLCLDPSRVRPSRVCVLRLANVYGPGRAPWQPRAGALCAFGARLLQGEAPQLFEDGQQRRDFVHVYDAARAFRLAVESPAATGPINIGSGRAYPVSELARRLAIVLGKQHIAPQLTHGHRTGDVRHAVPDVARARAALGFAARMGLDEGLIDLAAWLEECGAEARPRIDPARTASELRV